MDITGIHLTAVAAVEIADVVEVVALVVVGVGDVVGEIAGKRNSNNTHYQFWIQDNHPIELSSNEMMDQKLNYIHDNPVQAGFVNEAENYLYSSARDYCGIRGLIKVCLIE